MHVSLDGLAVDVPAAATLGELLDGIAPLIEPARLVTRVEVDGAPIDGSDLSVVARWRLAGSETVSIGTEAPAEFARARRGEIPRHLRRIAELLSAAAGGFEGGETAAANQVLAVAARELSLVLELDQQLAVLDPGASDCRPVTEAVRRVGPRLEEAEREGRWEDVARLLTEELVPALRLGPG